MRRRQVLIGRQHTAGRPTLTWLASLNDKSGLEGAFAAVRDAFRLPGSRKLLERMAAVNEFRNTYIAHHEKDLTDKMMAETNLKHWVETLTLLKV